ncbi:MAG: 50S ribosome-binding GTPase [Treponema sp.]|nr:50S ribosome-binding GTPase [Candidatus Treponema merdequi]
MEYSEKDLTIELEKLKEETKKPNILICGQTGAGKSSVVNYLFNDNIAIVGDGKPQTEDINLYENETVNIYDSEGYEIGTEKQQHYKKLILDDFLNLHKSLSENPEECVHLVWYAINGAVKRITDIDVQLIKQIYCNYKICILLTKIDEMDEEQLLEMKTNLEKELPFIKYFCLSTKDKKIESLKQYTQWDELITWSYDVLPDICRDKFLCSLREGLEEKRKQGKIDATIAAGIAAGIGASPLPFSDAALLVPTQTGMMLKIFSLFGIKISASSLESLVTDIGVSSAGKFVAGNLIKLIKINGVDGIGSVINASVAATFTEAIGVVLTEILYNDAKEVINGKKESMTIEEILEKVDFINQVMDYFKKAKKSKKA